MASRRSAAPSETPRSSLDAFYWSDAVEDFFDESEYDGDWCGSSIATADHYTGASVRSMSTRRSRSSTATSAPVTAPAPSSTLVLFPNLSLHKQLLHLAVTSTSPRRRRRRTSSYQLTPVPTAPASSESKGKEKEKEKAKDQPPNILVLAPTPPVSKKPAQSAASSPSKRRSGLYASNMTPKPPPRQLPTPPTAPPSAPPTAPLPAVPVPTAKFILPNHVALHPDFHDTGDVLIVCTTQPAPQAPPQHIGFLVNGTMLRMASPTLASLLDACPPTTPRILNLPDSPTDMHAFLRLLRVTSPSDKPYPPPFDPSISQCAGIHALTQKYNGWYPRAVLDFHVELRAGDIVDTLGPNAPRKDVYMLLRLAHALQSAALWAQVCDRVRGKGWWHDVLNPWRFGAGDIAALGQSIHSILCILASVSSREGLFSHLDELCVLYSEDGDVSVAAAERGGACCACSGSAVV